MTTPANPDDLLAFVRAQLDDDERVAREALHPDAISPGVWTTERHNSEYHSEPNRCHIAEDRSGHYWSVAHEVFIPNAEHMARWDPARVLAEVDAKRRIMAIHHPRKFEGMGGLPQICDGCGYEGICDDPVTEDINDCPILRLLALPFADREGFREEWRPE